MFRFLIAILVFSPIIVCVDPNNHAAVRNLDSEVNYNDELGKFYYPVSHIKLPEDQSQTLTPANTKPDETYTIESSLSLTQEELNIDQTTGIVNVKHIKTSAKGEVTVTVTCSNSYTFTFVVDFLESKYVLGAEIKFATPYNTYVEECRVPSRDIDEYRDGNPIRTPINMFKVDQTADDLRKIVGEGTEINYIHLNVTGYLKVDKAATYTFYVHSAFNSLIEIDKEIILTSYDHCPDITKEEFATIELTEGYHEVLLHAVGGNPKKALDTEIEMGGWGFDFKYKIDDGEKDYITLYYLPDYTYAHSLLFFKSSYSWGVNVLQSIEFTVKNAAYCVSEPPLPPGIEITTKMITGTSSETFVKSFLISCLSTHSTTNKFNVSIEVTDVFLAGLVGYYMKYDIYTTPRSTMIKRNDPSAHLKVLRIESNINKGYNAIPTVWKGLGAEFVTEFGVHWEGVIKFPKPGSYSMKLTCDDSCYLKIQKTYELNLYGGGNITKTFNYKVGEDDSLSQYILLEYSQNKGASLFEFLVKGPDDDDFKYPNPPGQLQYTYILAVYTKDVDLPASNKPIINGVDLEIDEPKFSVNKNLPRGITLDPDSGIIGGKPLVSLGRDEYIITVEFKNHESLSVAIFITVEDITPPKDVYFFNPTTDEKYTSDSPGTVYLGSYLSLQASDDSNTKITGYFYDGNLPSTSFDEDKGILSGILSELGEFTVILNGWNGAGSDTSEIKITVKNNCENGKQNILFSLSPTSQKYEFSVVDRTGKTVISPIDVSQIKTWYHEVCMAENTDYTVKVWNNIPHDLKFETNIYANGKHIISEIRQGSSVDGGTYEYNFRTTSIPSTISYSKSDFVWEQYTSAAESPVFYNKLVNFKITPSYLPTGVTFDSNGNFIGVAKETFAKTEYNITAETLDGEIISLPITIEVIQTLCTRKGNALIHVHVFLHMAIYSKYMYMAIKDKSNNIVMEIAQKNLDNDIYTARNIELDYYKCVPPGEHILHCESPSVDGTGWEDSFMDVYLDDAPMGHCNIEDKSEGPVIYEAALHLSYNIDINTEWEYSYKLAQGWNTNSFTGSWSKAKIENIPTEGNSLYLRKLIPIHDVDSFSAFYSRFDIMSGIIYYINGKEMGRVNVPAGSLSDSQKATKSFKGLTPVSYVLPIAMFEKQEALVAIELHRYSDTEQFNVIALHTVDLNGDDQESCTRLYTFGKVTSADPPESSARNKASFAMDSQSGTFYQGNMRSMVGKEPSMKISFGENRHVFINRFMYVGTMKSQYSSGPSHIDFNGKKEDGYYLIGSLDIPQPQDSSEIISTDIYENNYLTNELEVNFIRANSYSGIFKVHDIMPGVCHIFYCMKNDILPYTPGGKNVTIGCPNEASGERTFLCPTGKRPQWREIANSCPSPPVILEKIDSYDFEVGKSEKVTLFTYSGYIKSLSISPGLPSCIKQEPFMNGVFTADKCYDELAPTEFTFIVSNDYGSGNVSCVLSIKPTNKPVIMNPVSSYVFYVGTNVEMFLFKVLGPSLVISVEPSLPKGLSLDFYTGKITGSPVEEVDEKSFLFSISNSYDKIVVSIKLSVAVTNKPVIIEPPSEKTTFIYGFDYRELHLYRVLGKNLNYFVNSGKLPDGLKVDGSTGTFSGKVVSKESGSVVIAVKSNEGSDTVEMTINYEVIESDKPFVIENKDEQVFEFGTEVENIKLFEVAGENVTYSVTPALPEGLVLDEKTGIISGSVKANTGNKIYTFYFKNAKGIESCKILLSFNIPIIPVILSYRNTTTFVKNVYIEPTSILTVSGKDFKYKVTPDLPNGMKIKEDTGVISGIPVENSKNTYTFTVYNSNGNNSVSVVIEIITKYCESDGEWGRTEITTKNYIGCNAAYSGNKYRSCLVTDNGEAVWGGIIDDCSIETGLIVGIVIVCIIAVALIVLVVVFCIYRRNAIRKVNSDKRRKINSDKGVHM